MKRIAAKQRGASGGGFAAIIVVIVIAVLLLLKVFPVYMENFNVSSSLNSLSDEQGIKDKKKSEIKELLQRRFSINNVVNVNKKHITINRTKTGMSIDIIYEVRKPLVGNVDLVMYFNEQVML